MPDSGNYGPIPEPVPPLSVPEFEYDDLEKKKRIGAGGDADVYGATLDDGGTTYPVALKEPRFEGTLQQRIVEQFKNEAEMWSQLDDHDNIVTVYAWGTERLPWLALEYMDGGTLQARLGSFDIGEALWLAGRIAEGVRYGHRHGVAHLDVKPSNVLLRDTGDGTWDYPKVSDWGLAKLLLEHSQSVAGLSPTYAAPEQFDTDGYGKTDDITDIYQLGAVVYAMLTGQPPFSGSSRAVMQSILQNDPVPPSERNSGLPAAVDDVVLKALAKDKAERYDGVLTFRRKLDRLFEAYSEGRDVDTVPGTTGTVTGSIDSKSSAAAGSSGGGDGDAEEKADSGSGSPLTRRSALGVLGIGILGGSGLFVAAELGGDGGTSGGTAGSVQTTTGIVETTTEIESTTEPRSSNGTFGTTEEPTRTRSITNRLQVMSQVGYVSERQIVGVETTIGPSPGSGDVDLEGVVIQWVSNATSAQLIAYRGGDPDAETVEGGDRTDAFSWEVIRDDNSSVADKNTLDSPEDRVTVTIDLDDEPGLEPLAEGESATAQFTTASGAETSSRLVVPDTLANSDVVNL